MAKTQSNNMDLFLGLIRAFLGDFTVKVDRQAQLVTIRAKGREYQYTYDQLVDELEKLLHSSDTVGPLHNQPPTRPAAP